MASYSLGRAIFETGVDLTGLNRGLTKAEQRVKAFGLKIERQVKGGKAFSFTAPLEKQTAAINKFSKQAEQSLGRVKRASAGTSNALGKMVTKYLAAGAVLYGVQKAFRATINAAKDFEVAITNIDTLAANTTEQMALLRQGVLDLASVVGEGPTKLASALYDVVSAGYSGAEGLKVLEASAKAARAGLTTTKVAADAVTTTLNAYGLAAEQATHVTDVLQTTVKYGKTTWGELAPVIGQVIPLAAAAGVSIEELGGALAVLTGNGVQTSQAVTQVRSLIAALLKDTSQAREVMDKYNFSISASTLQQKGLIGTLKELQGAIGGDTEALFKFLGRVEAVNAALALTTDQGFKKLVSVTEEMRKAGGVVDEAFNKQLGTAQGQIDRFTAALDALKITLGNELLPTIGIVAGALAGLIEKINDLANPRLAAAKKLVLEAGVAEEQVSPEQLSKIAGIQEQLRELREVERRLKDLDTVMRTSGVGAFISGLETVAARLGMTKEELAEVHKEARKALREGRGEEFAAQFAARVNQMLQSQKSELQASLDEALKPGPGAEDLSQKIEQINRSLNNARQQAQQLGSADIFKTAAAKAVESLKALRQEFASNEEVVQNIDNLIKSIETEAANFKVAPQAPSEAEAEDFLKPYRDALQNITLKSKLGLIDEGTARRQLEDIRNRLQKVLEGTGDQAKQNSIMTLILSLDLAMKGLQTQAKSTDDAFQAWLQKLEVQAKRGLRPVSEIKNEVASARQKILEQIRALGPLDTREKVEILFELSAKLDRLDGLSETLKGATDRQLEAYREYYRSRVEGLGYEMADEARAAMQTLASALSGEADFSQGLAAAEKLRGLIEQSVVPIPDAVKTAALELLDAFDAYGAAIADGFEKAARAVNQARFGEGILATADAFRRSFDTVGEALVYLGKNGQLTEENMRALGVAYGEVGQTLEQLFTGASALNLAFKLGIISADDYRKRLSEARDVLQTIIQTVEVGSPAFDQLADALLRVNEALNRLGRDAGDPLQGIDDLSEALSTLAADGAISREEAVRLAKGFGGLGEAVAGAVGGLGTWNARLQAGLITEDEYRTKLEMTRDILQELAQRYKDDPVLLELYAGALDSVNQQLATLSDTGGQLSDDSLLPEELDRRASLLSARFREVGEALASLAKDGRLTEQEMSLLSRAFGDQGQAILDAFDGFREIRTAFEIGQIGAEEFRSAVEGILPQLEEAIQNVERGTPAWYMLAEAIKAAKSALGDGGSEAFDLGKEIASGLSNISSRAQVGLLGNGLEQRRQVLEETASLLREKIAEGLKNGLDPDNPEIQAALEKLQSTEIELKLVTAGAKIADAFVDAAASVGQALGEYLVNGGAEAGARLYDALVSASETFSNVLKSTLTDLGADLGGKLGQQLGESIGGAVGGALGAAGGPLGMAIGTAIGAAVGSLLGSLLDFIFKAPKAKPEPDTLDKRVTTSVSEVNYTAIANLNVTEGANMRDPQFRSELRGFVRQTATELLDQLGLVKGGANA